MIIDTILRSITKFISELFLGKPFSKYAELKLSNENALKIYRHGQGKTVDRVVLNGCKVEGYKVAINQILKGGTLEFYMK